MSKMNSCLCLALPRALIFHNNVRLWLFICLGMTGTPRSCWFLKFINLQTLILRNQRLSKSGAGHVPSEGIALPFLLVRVCFLLISLLQWRWFMKQMFSCSKEMLHEIFKFSVGSVAFMSQWICLFFWLDSPWI